LNDHSGVPVEQVDFEFWPNSDHSSARNSRNVAISNIRRALGDIGSQVIIRENNHVKYSGDTKDHCDLYLFNELLNNHHPSKEQLVEAIEIFGNHGLAPSVEEKWIDPIREYYHQKVRRAARSLALIYTKDNQWKALTRLGRKILLWDDLDDDGIRMLVIGLKERDKPFMAHNEYHKYNDRYLEEMGDKYEISFERMVVT
jgi:DNA-binding SARP family transcriptional activator